MRVVLLGLLGVALSFGTLNHIYIDQRQDVEKGKDFGAAGPYERIVASAVYEPDVKIEIEYIKPRNPAKGNGGLVLLTGKSGNPEPLMERGYSILHMKTGDAAAIREMVSFLRFGGGPEPFLLGDQKRFIKRAIAVGDAAALESILLTNKDPKNRRIFDGVVISGGKEYQAPADVRSMKAKTHINDAIVELDVQLSAPSN